MISYQEHIDLARQQMEHEARKDVKRILTEAYQKDRKNGISDVLPGLIRKYGYITIVEFEEVAAEFLDVNGQNGLRDKGFANWSPGYQCLAIDMLRDWLEPQLEEFGYQVGANIYVLEGLREAAEKTLYS